MKLLRIRAMMAAGFPYTKDDLTIEEWLDLGQVQEIFNQPLTCPLMRRDDG